MVALKFDSCNLLKEVNHLVDGHHFFGTNVKRFTKRGPKKPLSPFYGVIDARYRASLFTIVPNLEGIRPGKFRKSHLSGKGTGTFSRPPPMCHAVRKRCGIALPDLGCRSLLRNDGQFFRLKVSPNRNRLREVPDTHHPLEGGLPQLCSASHRCTHMPTRRKSISRLQPLTLLEEGRY